MMRACVITLVLAVMASAAAANGASSEQPWVVVGDAAMDDALFSSPSLEAPVLLEESSWGAGALDTEAAVTAELEAALQTPAMLDETRRIEENQRTLADLELLAHQMGAPVIQDMMAKQGADEVHHITHSLLEHSAKPEPVHISTPLPTALLEQAPVMADEEELAMVELSSSLEAPLDKKNDYAFLDDPKTGGKPTVLQNLKGLDIYVVNTPVHDNDNEIRPVKPPHPMSVAMRERAKVAAQMRSKLIHDIPQPVATVKPKTKIDTLSAYEPSLQPSQPLNKISRLTSRYFDHPLVGGIGAQQLRGISQQPAPRFAQLDMELPGAPSSDAAAKNGAITVGKGSSFDNRDGPPVQLDSLLPLKAQLVETLDPLLTRGSLPDEATPVGWGSPPANVPSPFSS